MKVIKDVRESNLANDYEEALIGVHSVAVPICGSRNEFATAISISGPRDRMTKGKMVEFSRFLTEAAKKISKDLGLEK